MIVKILTVVFQGIEAQLVEVQTHIGNGLPCFNIVGLANRAVNESKERIKAAFSSININLPPKRITINLSPSDLHKDGSHFDLPIALSLLVILNIIPNNEIKNYIALGELSLSGEVLSTKGTLATLVTSIKYNKNLIFPSKQIKEVGIFSERLTLLPVKNLQEIIYHFTNKSRIIMPKIIPKKQILSQNEYLDISYIKGQETAKRCLEIAAAGGHNMLMIGPPGVGKTSLANTLRGITPPLTKKEMLEVSIIYSISGLMGNNNLITTRPFRAPHHTISDIGLIGGGPKITPGEITLSSKGILFLDEMVEFSRTALDSLREPLETGKINISRANQKVTLPSDFQLIGAINPCYCGYFSIPGKECNKSPNCAINYQNKLSGPLLDRIDLIIELSEPETYNILNHTNNIQSKDILKKVIKARFIQEERYKDKNFKINSKMDNNTIQETIKNIQSNPLAWNILNRFSNKYKISIRSYYKIIKLSRTISDLKESSQIDEFDISEAISYRKTNYRSNYIK